MAEINFKMIHLLRKYHKAVDAMSKLRQKALEEKKE